MKNENTNSNENKKIGVVLKNNLHLIIKEINFTQRGKLILRLINLYQIIFVFLMLLFYL